MEWENDLLDGLISGDHQDPHGLIQVADSLGKTVLSPALHLDSPITSARWREYFDQNKSYIAGSQSSNFTDLVHLQFKNVNDKIIQRSHAKFYGNFFLDLVNSKLPNLPAPKISLVRGIHHGLMNLHLQERASMISRPSDHLSSCRQIITLMSSAKLIKDLYAWMALASDLVKIQAALITKVKPPLDNNTSSLMFISLTSSMNNNYVYVEPSPHTGILVGAEGAKFKLNDQIYILTREMFLGWSDLIHERFMVYLSLTLMAELKRKDYPPPDLVTEVFMAGDALLKRLGNDAYLSIKFWEPACIARLLMLGQETITDPNVFSTHTFTEIPDQLYKTTIFNLLGSINDTNWVSQLFGLYRLWGHPLVHTEAGINKIQEKSFAHKEINKEVVKDTVRIFKHLYLTGFIKKYKRWPSTKTTPLHTLSNYLAYCKKSRQTPKLTDSRLKLADYDSITIEQQFAVDKSFNIPAYLSDKALSLSKPELLRMVRKNQTIGSAEQRKVLINWIKSDYTSPTQILNIIETHGFNADDLVIGVVPKEREMKIDPRMFALLTLLARLYFVITEHMIAESLLPLFPQITMKDSGLELTKRLLKLTRGQAINNNSVVNIVMNIDFEKWNTNMRGEFVTPIFEEIDRLFGYTAVISRTHEFFQNSLIYLATSEAAHQINIQGDDLILGQWAWKGHLGGLEGLRQKGWTIATVCLIELAAYKNYLTHELIGQGDNQVLVLKIPKPTQYSTWESNMGHAEPIDVVKSRLMSFEKTLYHLTALIGLPIKEEETWKSTTLAAYGKVLFHCGRPLPMSLKRLSRMFPLANEEFPSLDSDLATVFNTGVAATQYDIDHTAGFFGASFWIPWIIESGLRYHPGIMEGFESAMFGPRTGNKLTIFSDVDFTWPSHCAGKTRHRLPRAVFRQNTENKKTELLWLITLRTKILGGYSIQHLPAFWAKGFPDPVTASLSFLKNILEFSKSSDPLCRIINLSIKRIFNLKLSSEVQSLHLLQDPVSINLDIPPNGKPLLKDYVKKSIKTISPCNPQVQQLLNQPDNLIKELADQLYKLEPFPAFLISDILDASVPGYTSSFFSKFEKTSTLLAGAAKTYGRSMKQRIILSELQYFSEQIRCNTECGIDPPKGCTVDWVDRLRTEGWKKKVEGVTVPFPLETLSLHWISDKGCKYCTRHPSSDHIKISLDYRLQDNNDIFWKTLGPNIPYLGSETHEKVTTTGGGRLDNPDPLLLRAAKLQRTIGWFISKGSSAHKLISHLWDSISDFDSSTLEASEGISPGSGHHRFSTARNVRSGTYLPQYTPLTYIQLSTSTMWSYAGKSNNTTIHFQYFLNQVQGVITSNLINKSNPFITSGAHMHIVCHECIRDIQEDNYEGDKQWEHVVFPSLPGSQFLWVDKSKISFQEDFHAIANFPTLSPLRLQSTQLSILTHYLSAWDACSCLLKNVSHIPTDQVIPISWLSHLNPVIYLEFVLFILYVRAVGSLIKTTTMEISKVLENAVTLVSNWLWHTSSSNLSMLAPMFYHSSHRQILQSSKYNIQGYSSYPPTDNSTGSSVRRALLSIMMEFSDLLIRFSTSQDYKILRCPWRAPNSCKDPVCFWTLLRIMILEHNFDSTQQLKELGDRADNILNTLLRGSSINIEDKDMQKIISSLTYKITKKQILDIPNSLEWLVKALHPLQVPSLTVSPFVVQDDMGSTYITTQVAVRTVKLIHHVDKMFCPHIELTSTQLHYASHFYRTFYGLTSAWQKLYPILVKNFQLLSTSFVVGDGTGGISSLIGKITNQQCTLYFNSLFTLDNVLPQALAEITPPALDYCGITSSFILNKETLGQEISNIASSHFATYWIKRIQRPITCMISDAEFGFGQYQIMYEGLKQLLTICLAKGAGRMMFLFKTYLNCPTLIIIMLQHCLDVFLSVELYRSGFSNQTGSEVYIYCKNLKEGGIINHTIQVTNQGIHNIQPIEIEKILGSGLLSCNSFILNDIWSYTLRFLRIGQHLFRKTITKADLGTCLNAIWLDCLDIASPTKRFKQAIYGWTHRMRWYAPFFLNLNERKKAHAHEYFPAEKLHMDIIGLLITLSSLTKTPEKIKKSILNLIQRGIFFQAIEVEGKLKAFITTQPNIYLAPGTELRQTQNCYLVKLFTGENVHLQKLLFKCMALVCQLDMTIEFHSFYAIKWVFDKKEGISFGEEGIIYVQLDWAKLRHKTHKSVYFVKTSLSRWIEPLYNEPSTVDNHWTETL